MFSEGLTESQLDSIEHRIHASLPNDYRCSCRLFSGQENWMDFAASGYDSCVFRT